MQNGRIERLTLNLFVPRKKQFLHPIPHLDQTTGRDRQLHVKAEYFHKLTERITQPIMQPRSEHHHSQSQFAARQRSGDRCFDFFPALAAPIAMDGVFSHLGLRIGNVLDVTHASFAATIERTTTVRTFLGAMVAAMVDFVSGFLRCEPACPARAPGFFLRFFTGGFW
jgi:hypothetical protein